ncbi:MULTISPECIES: aldo/keto reductase [Achromobacter]|uniref:2,5-diketo-D-gluconic acid reductase A n=1 Tax=Achromobacter insolitus TaxID=217204 RepID=A0A6S7F489_9BURK|nr:MULTISPECIES: aldo/keto reductase [Achromobacter]GLK94286.1 oxidoreductase [Achromobacter xylosoxidans]AVG38630.1 oxidoreductase [Achromobacter insolitus]AXA69313.1 oxidoreductase [Achromobacter insolitus]MCP1404123.1 2,5-diketo-D-gluconate reductase A [Achromobacter insolitus]MDQ6217172.1 aldo/keto reductase [Achromobacter insolitus]
MAKVPAVKLNDGSKIPQLGLGVWQVPNDQAAASVKEALAAGYRSVDTAAIYGNEAGVGAGLRAAGVARKDLFITTKLWNDRHGYDEAHKAMDESLEKLGLAYVDLYLIHWPVAGSTKFVDAWKAMIEMKEDGRARSIGVSNFTQANLERLIDASGVTPSVNQVELHPGFTQRALRAFHARHGIATESWSPLAQGGVAKDKVILELAKKYGKSAAQVTLRWHLQSDLIVIPKSVTPARIRENIDVFDFELSAADMAAIDGIKEGARLGPDPETFGK